jgi:hypothetical protein
VLARCMYICSCDLLPATFSGLVTTPSLPSCVESTLLTML